MTNLDIDKVFKKNSFNCRLLLKEMDRRNISLSPLKGTFIISAKYEDHEEKLYDAYSNLLSYTKGILTDDKYFCKKYLSSYHFFVTQGEVFSRNIKQALLYSKKIGFPVVFKPTMSSHGDNVIMDIENEDELRGVIKKFISSHRNKSYYLIEKQFEGNEYRLFVTRDGFFAAVQRIPPKIAGDGKSTIKKLIENENYKRMHPRNTCLCEIPTDMTSKEFLKKQNLTFYSVPSANQIIYLRKNSNVSTGGNCYDVTDKVNAKYLFLAKKIIKIFDVPFLGIDLLCEDISKFGEYAICELNSAPGISMHTMPEKGKRRNVTKAIVDIIFPETKND